MARGEARRAARRGRWALAAALGACGPPAAAPSLPGASPAAPPSSEPASSAPPPAGLPSGMKPHTGAWLASDVSQAFAERAWLVSPRHLRQRRGEPLGLAGGNDPILPLKVIVVAHEGEASRVVVETRDVRLLFWATPGAFEPVPVRPQRLALAPGRYPQGPEGMPGRDELGVWVTLGWYDLPLARRDGWREVNVEDRVIKARGWLDESQFGLYFTPVSLDDASPGRGGVRSGSRLLASPAGPVILALPFESPPYLMRWFEQVGPAVAGFVHVRYRGSEAWVEGLVRASEFETGLGGGMGWAGRATFQRGVRTPPLRLALEASAALHDAPGGDIIGRTLRRVEIPDRVDPTPERGLRRVEVPVGEVGLVPAWVEASALSPLPAASAPASSAPAPAR